jgi:serine/threonine protein kinase
MFLYEIVTGMTPFVYCHTSKEVIYAVTVKKDRPTIPPPEIQIHDIIRKCWDDNPDERPSMEEVMLILLTETVALPGSDVDKVFDYIREIGWAEA